MQRILKYNNSNKTTALSISQFVQSPKNKNQTWTDKFWLSALPHHLMQKQLVLGFRNTIYKDKFLIKQIDKLGCQKIR